jgi:hypothetical protein
MTADKEWSEDDLREWRKAAKAYHADRLRNPSRLPADERRERAKERLLLAAYVHGAGVLYEKGYSKTLKYLQANYPSDFAYVTAELTEMGFSHFDIAQAAGLAQPDQPAESDKPLPPASKTTEQKAQRRLDAIIRKIGTAPEAERIQIAAWGARCLRELAGSGELSEDAAHGLFIAATARAGLSAAEAEPIFRGTQCP